MEKLHSVIRTINNETKAEAAPRRDHLDVFREFLDHLNRVSRKKAGAAAAKPKAKSRRRR